VELAQEILGITAAKNELPSRIRRLQSGQLGRVVIVRQNSPVAVIVSVEEYDRIRSLESVQELIEDLEAVIEARDADDGTRITLDQIKAKYGID
jgi:prevent-host-death family protein